MSVPKQSRQTPTDTVITVAGRFFKDKNGQWVIGQFPNALLWVWIGLVVLIWVFAGASIVAQLKNLQSAVLFAWAYLELTDGDSCFRTVLGAVVMAMVMAGYFGLI